MKPKAGGIGIGIGIGAGVRLLPGLVGLIRGLSADALSPPSCAVCSIDAPDTPLCDDCRAELLDASGISCPRCARPTGPWADLRGGCSECRGKRLGFDAAMALGPYSGPIRDLCLRLKHQHNAWLAPCLASLIVEARQVELDEELAGDPSAVVVPVPLHWRRRLSRGYNQAESLASAIAARLRRPMVMGLRRTLHTAPLALLSPTERAATLRDAFRARHAHRLRGRTVLLADDILTTGATCGSAARALKAAGARRVVALVAARTAR